MSHAASYAPPPLDGCVVLVVDATTGTGRVVTARLCAAGAAVAVVGAGHRGRGDDAATNAAFLCKELADIGLVALPYQVDAEDTEAVLALPAQIAADIGPLTAAVVIVPAEDAPYGLADTFRAVSAAVEAGLPVHAVHIEIDQEARAEELARSVVDRLLGTSGSGSDLDSEPESSTSIRG
ncbi:hypothetical protein OG564_14465 [Streptomyces sp. NBC_01280]|uniref:hypothetical protein n=1 Tax=unclassified Streptomyces TaxID=2593676 RepID=UPI0019D2CFCD|nr:MULTISPECIES: hypothetical protein [unclassified Streptomyces]